MKKTLIIFIACINAALAADAKTHYEIQLDSKGRMYGDENE